MLMQSAKPIVNLCRLLSVVHQPIAGRQQKRTVATMAAYSVAVVGAGMAGAAAGVRLRELGAKVDVFDLGQRPGMCVRCTSMRSFSCQHEKGGGGGGGVGLAGGGGGGGGGGG